MKFDNEWDDNLYLYSPLKCKTTLMNDLNRTRIKRKYVFTIKNHYKSNKRNCAFAVREDQISAFAMLVIYFIIKIIRKKF